MTHGATAREDHNYKSSSTLLRMLVDCISLGGNLLLDIGPKADGTIPEEEVKVLKDLGRWTKKACRGPSTTLTLQAFRPDMYTPIHRSTRRATYSISICPTARMNRWR